MPTHDSEDHSMYANATPEAEQLLRILASRKNAIISGPPGTGKSRLLNEIRELFKGEEVTTGSDVTADIPLPPTSQQMPEWYPSPHRSIERKVFQTVFDQNTKYRDFMRGLVPKIGSAGVFTTTSGTLYRASLHAKLDGNASLVIIDEINRGPAVAAFGSSLVALEPDKRLGDDGNPTQSTQFFEILGDEGEAIEYAFPPDLYIIAAMNEADTSVEPLDVAFLRRFHIFRLYPDVRVLRAHLDLLPEIPGDSSDLPNEPDSPKDYYEALCQAFSVINQKILWGRGQAYQLGHGALMHRRASSSNLGDAREYAEEAWSTLQAHIDEVFFGNTRAIADVLCAGSGDGPYSLEESTFAGQSVRRITGSIRQDSTALYHLLRSIAATGLS